LIFRAFADDTIGFAPPLCISTDEVDLLICRLRQTLDTVLNLKELRQ
jgi:adenosylmethionine-8-amino-7-oxononanoate aminotransferase